MCYYCGNSINDEGEVSSLWVGGHRYCTQACYEAYIEEMERREQMDRFIDAMGGDQGALPWEDWEERESVRKTGSIKSTTTNPLEIKHAM